MADDNPFRSSRPTDPYGRNPPAVPGSRAGTNDPLEELARLIGQTDPFADLGRDRVRGSVRQPPLRPHDQRMALPPAPNFPPDPAVTRHDGFGPPPFFNPPPLDNPSHAEARPGTFHQPYNPAAYGSAQTGVGEFGRDMYYEGASNMPQGNEAYDDDEAAEPRPRRGLKVALVVVCLGLIGTAGAFAYRAIFSGGPSAPPPVIKADTTPSKVAAAQSGESKRNYDRFGGDSSQGEKVVSREEQPVNVGNSARPEPRIVFPPLTNSAERVDAQTAMATPLGGVASVGPAAAEPRKIPTIPIRPGQSPFEGVAPKPASAAAAPPRGSATASANPSLSPPAPAPVTSAARPAPAAASALSIPPAGTALPPPPAASPSMATSASPAQNGPLSLTPGASSDNAARSTSANRMAVLPPPPAPSRNAPIAVAPEPSAGSYTVQLSSQRSESEAQASFRALQGKFPNLLGDRQPIIRRADLGDKGIYFRAMVGPFASVDQATEFCGSLKSAGGQCVVQRN